MVSTGHPKIKVLIVDDSRVIQSLLREFLSETDDIEVVGTADDPYDAREKIKQLNPDVITLDIEMPRMDGITFLRNLMRLRPMPVVMVSTLTEKGADVTLEALEIGAIDVVLKPDSKRFGEIHTVRDEIIRKVRSAARANLSARTLDSPTLQPPRRSFDHDRNRDIQIIAIGASTGGTEAIKTVLQTLPGNMPPIAIVQHMPAGFTNSFAKRLDRLLDFTVLEFNQCETELLDNHVYIGNGIHHMRIQREGEILIALADDKPPVNRHKPSVDVLFESVANQVGGHSVGVLLTGMGLDGARGLGIMKDSGAKTVAQDEKTSVVWGMPRVAIQSGAATEVLPLNSIGHYLAHLCYG